MKPSEVLQKHLEAGVETIRCRYSPRIKLWEIVKFTKNGGWRRITILDCVNYDEALKEVHEKCWLHPNYRLDDGSTMYKPHKQ